MTVTCRAYLSDDVCRQCGDARGRHTLEDGAPGFGSIYRCPNGASCSMPDNFSHAPPPGRTPDLPCDCRGLRDQVRQLEWLVKSLCERVIAQHELLAERADKGK
jgi:hypothetical protein